MASLVWYSSARTAGQWFGYWLRQRLQWWRKVFREILLILDVKIIKILNGSSEKAAVKLKAEMIFLHLIHAAHCFKC